MSNTKGTPNKLLPSRRPPFPLTLTMLASIFLFVLRFLQLFLGLIFGAPEDSAPFATCGDCFCIPEQGTSCPTKLPETNFTDLVPILRSLTWNNPYTLECDPYNDPTCNTEPLLVEGGACVIKTSDLIAAAAASPTGSCPTGYSYSLSTYSGTFSEAMLDPSVYVTHEGRCGACSTRPSFSPSLARR